MVPSVARSARAGQCSFHRKARRRRGTAVVELAVVAPRLGLLIFGMIEIGRGLMVQQLITNGARDGARAAVLEGATASSVETEVLNYLAGSGVNGASVAVSPSDLSTAAGGTPITVTVSVPYASVSWLPSNWFLGTATLTSSVSMRREVFTSSSTQ